LIDDHARVLGWATIGEIAQMKTLTHRVNEVLRPLFSDAGIDLVEDKMAFGHPRQDRQGALVLGDEFTPDGCRLWDQKTGETLDKDRFRHDLGEVIEPTGRKADRRCAVSDSAIEEDRHEKRRQT
jgi:phosphoribosylaminoimidazole-succinocarboxamide synthase